MWAPIPNYEGYEVSDLGEVRCWNPANGVGEKGSLKEPRYLTLSKFVDNPYLRVGMRNSSTGKYENRRVHQIVLEAFIGPKPSDLHEVLHHNDIPSDNRLTNLSYGTHEKNIADMVSKGRSCKGESHPKSLVSDLIREQIVNLAQTLEYRGSRRDIAEMLGIPVNTVYRVIATNTVRNKS